MSDFKRELILNTSEDIKNHILNKHGIEVDELDIAELINLNIGWVIVLSEELMEKHE